MPIGAILQGCQMVHWGYYGCRTYGHTGVTALTNGVKQQIQHAQTPSEMLNLS